MTDKKSDAMFDVGQVRRRLSELGVTQGALASYLKVDTSAVSKGLGGKRKFSPREQTLITRFIADMSADLDKGGLRSGRLRSEWRMDNLRHFMNHARMDENTLAMACGVSVREMKRLLLDIGPPMTDEMAANFASAVGYDLDGPKLDIPGKPTVRPDQRMPLYAAPGLAEAPLFDYVLSPAGSVETPPGLRDVPGAFAMYCPEIGIGRHWRPGDTMFLHPRMPMLVGAEAMIVIDEQFLSIGRLVASDFATISLQVDDDPPNRFERSKLSGFYKIAGAWFR